MDFIGDFENPCLILFFDSLNHECWKNMKGLCFIGARFGQNMVYCSSSIDHNREIVNQIAFYHIFTFIKTVDGEILN